MLETLKQIILDFQETVFETGVPRHLKIKTLKGKATVCIGVRRCGKSTYLFQMMDRLLKKGVPKQNILYVNFFDDRLHNLRQNGPSPIIEAYYSLYPEKKNEEKVYCFFDEIQTVEGWEPFVDRLMRTEKCEVCLTGSSARMLSKEIATQMRGRALAWELFPLSFHEFLDFKKIDGAGPLTTKRRLILQKAFKEYRETGGFPEVINQDRHLRTKIHQEYYHAVLFRDLIERHDIAHPRALTDLVHRLIDNAASLYTVNSLTGYLQSLGHKVPKASVSDFLEWLEDAYFLFTVRLFDASLARSKTNPKKIYCVDHALVESVSSGTLFNSGHLLENLVFMGLRRMTSEIFYYKTKTGREVDFLAKAPDRSRILIQVCESMEDPKTRKREIDSLFEAMSELKLKSSTIITKNEEASIENDRMKISVVPAWRFLLELPAAL